MTFEKGQRKDDIAHQYLEAFDGEEGVLFVGKAQEKASVFRTEKRRDAQGRCASEAAGQPVPPAIPVVVLSGAHQMPASLAAHAAMATRHVLASGSGHWIHLDDPSLVAEAALSAAPRTSRSQG